MNKSDRDQLLKWFTEKTDISVWYAHVKDNGDIELTALDYSSDWHPYFTNRLPKLGDDLIDTGEKIEGYPVYTLKTPFGQIQLTAHMEYQVW
jgi:hypothetical protein